MHRTSDNVSFDEQARDFEARAGLTDDVEARIAAAVLAFGAATEGDLVVEIGAGTGEIGAALVRSPIRYLGLDRSAAMLDEFRPRIPAGAKAELKTADANAAWPVADGAAKIVFGSRVFHLLDIAHAVAEARRVLGPGGVLVSGRVQRDPASPKTRARKKMHALLAEAGFAPRRTDQLRKQVLETAERLGGVRLEPVAAASWPVTAAAADSIAGWRRKDSMGGLTPPPAVKAEVLAALEAWAKQEFGDPAAPVATTETYILEGVRFGA